MTNSRGLQRSEDSARARELMLAAKRGDREAFQELVRVLTPALTRSAYHMVHLSYVDDLVQDTWYRAWKYRLTYRGDAEPSTWLHSIMTTASKSRTLRPTPNGQVIIDDLACFDSAADLETFMVADAVDRVLAQLDDRQAVIVRRRYLAHEDWDTITQQMGFASAYQAKKAYRQAMRRLGALHAATPAKP